MAIQMFARGTGNFRLERQQFDFDDAYEIGEAMGRVMSIGDAPRDVIAGEVASFVEGQSGQRNAWQIIFDRMGQITGVHLLTVGAVAALIKFHEFHLTVSAREHNYIFPDSGGNCATWINDPDPVEYLLQSVSRPLGEANMQTFGALTAIGTALSHWSVRGENGRNGEARLFIQLYKE